VLGPRGVKQDVLAELTALLAAVTETEDRQQVNAAIDHLTRSLAPELWKDQTHLWRQHGEKAFQEESAAVASLGECARRKTSVAPKAVLPGFIERIVRADRLLAWVAIEEAISAGTAPRQIAAAQSELAEGDEEVLNGQPAQGIEHYRRAWGHATRAPIEVR